MSDPTPYNLDQLSQLPESGDPRVFLDYQLRIIKGSYDNGSISGGGGNTYISASDTGTQAIPNATGTPITFDTEDYSQNITHSTSSNTEKFTIVDDGLYHIGGTVHIQTGFVGTGTATLNLSVERGASTTVIMQVIQDIDATALDAGTVVVNRDYLMVAGDVVQLNFSESGVTAGVTVEGQQFWMTKY